MFSQCALHLVRLRVLGLRISVCLHMRRRRMHSAASVYCMHASSCWTAHTLRLGNRVSPSVRERLCAQVKKFGTGLLLC